MIEHISIYEPVHGVKVSGIELEDFMKEYHFKKIGDILYNHNLLIDTSDKNNTNNCFRILIIDKNIIDYEIVNAMIDDGIVIAVEKKEGNII